MGGVRGQVYIRILGFCDQVFLKESIRGYVLGLSNGILGRRSRGG